MFERNGSWGALVCLAVLVALTAVPAGAQEGEGMPPEMMQAWIEAISPGAHHEHYRAVEGKWKADIRAWMQPGAPPSEISGLSEYEMVMGMPYEGFGLSGYDNLVGKHTVMWVDTMGGGEMKTKMVTRFESDDKHVFEYYMIGPDGSETKALEIVYTRM